MPKVPARPPGRAALPRRAPRGPVGLALAGGGPFGAIYEVGALMALQEALDGLEFHALDTYVGVSAGSLLTAALANGIPITEIHDRFIRDDRRDAVVPGAFMRPAWREYLARARALPPGLARSAWRWVRDPASVNLAEALGALGGAIPAGFFEGDAIDEYLADVFTQPGRTNDFRSLGRKLRIVATDLDTGESVSFGRTGTDDVPISKAVQASAALPGLFPPVAIGGRSFVDGALRKTLHASEALDDGARLVICLNPIVPYDARLAAMKGGSHDRLADGGLPRILSQTFRAILHSRMTVGLRNYRERYPGADVVLFEPATDDREAFFANLFSYASRREVCEHAYRRTRRDLLARFHELQPIFARHGVRLRREVLQDARAVALRPGLLGLPDAASELRGTLHDLREALARPVRAR